MASPGLALLLQCLFFHSVIPTGPGVFVAGESQLSQREARRQTRIDLPTKASRFKLSIVKLVVCSERGGEIFSWCHDNSFTHLSVVHTELFEVKQLARF